VVNNATKRNGIPVTQSEKAIELNAIDLDVLWCVLTLPGIVGLTFLDRGIPFQVFSWDAEFTMQQPEIFITSVTQVLQSMPTTFYQLEFGFGSYHICLRRFITGDAIAFVLRSGIDLQDYEVNLAAFCRLVMDQRSAVLAKLEAHQADYLAARQSWQTTAGSPVNGSGVNGSGVKQSPVNKSPVNKSPVEQEVMIRAFNQLAAMAGRYLGTAIMTRHLVRSRPPSDCLDFVTIDRKGQLEISNTEWLNSAQLAAFSEWIQHFVRECSKIIRNFDRLARQEGLTEEEIAVLFPDP
jgi:hypothetical protein